MELEATRLGDIIKGHMGKKEAGGPGQKQGDERTRKQP